MAMKIPLFKIYWDKEDVALVSGAIKRGMFWATGPNIEEFEKKISAHVGTKYCVTLNSGTSALHAALIAYGIGEGDEVIVPSFTFIATANAPLFVGAKPIFADIEEKTYGLDPEDVKRKITKKTKAIIPVHYGGCPCLIRELREIADDKGILLIEDAAEAFGARIGNKKVGTFGDAGVLSFCANKIITTGEGGAIVTDSREIHEKSKLIRSHGRLETADYFTSAEYMDYVELGYNFRMSNITAALGISQLKKIDKIIGMRRKNVKYLTKKLAEVGEVEPPLQPKDYFHVYQMYTIKLRSGDRDSLSKYLAEKGVTTKVFFHPVHLTKFYRNKFGYRDGELPSTEDLSKRVLTLPMYPDLTKRGMDFIADKIHDFFEKR